MRTGYMCDAQTGELIYWLFNANGIIMREYANGSFSPATEYEQTI